MKTETKTMKNAQHYDKNGFLIDEQGKRVVRNGQFVHRVARDGESVRVPMQFSDGKKVEPESKPPPFNYADARPKSAPVTDDDRARRQKLYSDADAKLENAWRGDHKENEDDE
jgi:hypothetical protein